MFTDSIHVKSNSIPRPYPGYCTEHPSLRIERKKKVKEGSSVSTTEAVFIVMSVVTTMFVALIAVLASQISSSWSSGSATINDVSVENLRESLEGPFGVNRHHLANPSGKAAARTHIIETFKHYGLEVTVQNFTAPTGNPNGNAGTNIIGVKRGKLSGTADDKIVAVGAHYDTVATSPGVDDDGSGMAAMLEIARVMTSYEQQNFTVIFVAFDHEEDIPHPSVAIGTPCETDMGSDDFVCAWLLPFIQSSGGPEFQGIFMLETIMNYDPRPDVQTVPPPFQFVFPSVYQDMVALNMTGSFLLLVHKPDEAAAVSMFQQTWGERAKDPANATTLNVNVPVTGKPADIETTTYYEFLGRSDCVSFWVREPYFRCVFVTDTANYRGTMRQCYHNPCDNVTSITDEKLTFLAKVTDSVLQTTMKLAEVNPGSYSTGETSAAVRFGGSSMTSLMWVTTACLLSVLFHH
ncbi:uncharacterized protein YfbL-like [Branchiostoma lanceolatum]|uniref:uncharacterized protein YfbL-like n=1 Tax=Branchiostoma lanceolatum TaxID=7740 RepID=UPI003453C2D5